MKSTFLAILLCLTLLSGCVLLDRYQTSDVVTDPVTGKQTVIVTEHAAPIEQVFKSVITPLSSGNWIGAIIAAVITATTSVLAAKKTVDAKSLEKAATAAAQLAEDLIPLAKTGNTKQAAGIALNAAATLQDSLGVRDLLRTLRPIRYQEINSKN